ncbi:hypothetical protein PGT21_012665 [Puccinia graminis f. sp. tritici]|uniref:Uncharacterized protein n=1 Tax=Puccinia graminis f. sp. tritici TaxID=56615 RepID=A0A5B0S843_PUCGR|nr:hypothetical protein PGT21_012665 [Puccinia graminis f. sp. tritici]KAA1134027.1 hypothetical protein PGTUg99_017953 [Puccinia graminis f. sp. tritici]
MSSYQTEPRAPSRDVSGYELPPERRRYWVELPGWVTAYLKTEVRKLSTLNNADVYDLLCELWKVPSSFGVATEDQNVYVITEALTKREASRASGLANVQRQTLAQEIVQVIEYLVENSSAKPKRLGWLDPNFSEKLQDVSPSDWIIFPASDMIHWLSDNRSNSAEKFLRHIPQQPPCRVCVFGNFNQFCTGDNGQSRFLAGSMQLSQIWHQGFFVTFTSKAATSNLEGLRKLVSKLVARQYDSLENPTGYVNIAIWLSLHTYWFLSPPSINEARTYRDDFIMSTRAFNQIHDPDLPPIPIINKQQLDNGIRTILNDGKTSINLMKSNILEKLKFPRQELPGFISAMSNFYDRRNDHEDELRVIQELASQLVTYFWMFRLALIVVSEEERPYLPRPDQLPCCQFVTFDTLLRLIESNFAL